MSGGQLIFRAGHPVILMSAMPSQDASSQRPSSLSPHFKAISEDLKEGAAERISDYSQRFIKVGDLYQNLLSPLIVSELSYEDAYDTAVKLLGSEEANFAGIDGTRYSTPMLDLVIFFGSAYASAGTIKFRKDAGPEVAYEDRFLDKGLTVSAIVPLFVNEIPEVDQTYFNFDPEGNPASHPLADQWHVDNSLIANSIMTFAEYFLAYKLVTDPEKNIRIVFLDRSLSGERTSLLYDTSKSTIWKENGLLVGFEVDGVKIDEKDLAYGRFHAVNDSLSLPPPRGDYLRYSILNLLENQGPLDFDGICERLGVTERDRIARIEKCLKRTALRAYLYRDDNKYALKPKYKTTWERLRKVVELIGEHLFSHEAKAKPNKTSSLQFRIGAHTKWLTTLDLSFLTLFCLQMLIEECWRRHVLVIGLTKDTAAGDLKRQFVPIMGKAGLIGGQVNLRDLDSLPNTDRMILQVVSINNFHSMPVPWSLVEYDSCFKTLVPDRRHGVDHVLGAKRNKTSLERLFLKSYVQLSQAHRDPLLRSNVLYMDRLVYPELDLSDETLTPLWNTYDAVEEPLEVLVYRNKSIRNSVQNLVMTTLSSMVSPSIPEIFGHNRPLFIADKVAKWHYENLRRIVDSTRDWILNNKDLKDFVFYMGSFRDRRSVFEAARRR